MDTKDKNIEERINESSRLREKYPDRIPIIIKKARGCKLPELEKNKYIVPNETSFGQFIHVIRKRIKLNGEQSIFCFVNNTVLPTTTETCGELYEKHKSDDGFLYVIYQGENTFG